MKNFLYQAKVGDGYKKKGLKRTDTFFSTPQEAVSEALALKERMNDIYKNEIKWDYNGKITGSTAKMNILKGYLSGDQKSQPFYLQIGKIEASEEIHAVLPNKPKKLTTNDKKVLNKVIELLTPESLK